LSILEAMACGLPCIVTDTGGNAESVEHLVTGLVVEPESVPALADAIAFLASGPAQCRRMGTNARIRVSERFRLEDQIEAVARVVLT
jgi:glycosyltransferase involved in cell wall biosynthesis